MKAMALRLSLGREALFYRMEEVARRLKYDYIPFGWLKTIRKSLDDKTVSCRDCRTHELLGIL